MRAWFWICGVLGLLVGGTTVAQDHDDCAGAYFGIGGSPDYRTAYACLSRRRERVRETGVLPAGTDGASLFAPLILMRIEGLGVARDLDEAATLLAEWKESGGDGAEQRLYLQRVLLERKSGLGAERGPLRFCELPGNASFRARCDEIERRRREAENERRLAELRERVPAAVREELPRLVFAFEGYLEREVERAARIEPLDRSTEPTVSAHRAVVQHHFDEALKEVLVEPALAEATALDASRRERDLTRLYDRDRREKSEAFGAYERSLPASADEYARHRRAYDDAAERAQDAWKRYRDVWVVVARAAAPDPTDAAAYEAATRSMLAAQRVREIRPEPDADLLEPSPLR